MNNNNQTNGVEKGGKNGGKKYSKTIRSLISAAFASVLIVLVRLFTAKTESAKPVFGELLIDFVIIFFSGYLTSVVISAANQKANNKSGDNVSKSVQL